MVKTWVIRLRVMDSSNTSDQIAFCAFHSFLVEVQTKVYMRRMRNNNLEIRIAGSSCRPQFCLHVKIEIKIKLNDKIYIYIYFFGKMFCSRSPPQVFFFCVKEPADGCGGETPLVKNSDLLSSLDPDIVRRFEEKQLRYVCYLPDKSNAEYMNWQHIFDTDNREVNDFVLNSISRPDVQQMYFSTLIFSRTRGKNSLKM